MKITYTTFRAIVEFWGKMLVEKLPKESVEMIQKGYEGLWMIQAHEIMEKLFKAHPKYVNVIPRGRAQPKKLKIPLSDVQLYGLYLGIQFYFKSGDFNHNSALLDHFKRDLEYYLFNTRFTINVPGFNP